MENSEDPSNVKHRSLVWRELNLMRSACARRVCFWTCTQKHSQNRNVGFVCFTPATRLHFGLPGVMSRFMSMLYFYAVDSRVCLLFRVPPPRLVDGIKKLRIRFLCLRPESTGDVALDSVSPKRCFRSKLRRAPNQQIPLMECIWFKRPLGLLCLGHRARNRRCFLA